MKSGFQIEFRESAGNLHISLAGAFNDMCAWALFKTIVLRCDGPNRMFVDTAGLIEVMPSGKALFKDHMSRKRLPPDRLYFKGEKGFQIAPEGSRVLVFNIKGKGRRRRIMQSDDTCKCIKKRTSPKLQLIRRRELCTEH